LLKPLAHVRISLQAKYSPHYTILLKEEEGEGNDASSNHEKLELAIKPAA
jgi:hypothetical protein